jgi:hypothetical protein
LNKTGTNLVSVDKGATTMFETTVQEEHTGVAWGIIIGLVALAALLAVGYALIA